MFFKSSFFRSVCAFCAISCLSVLTFADTIRLKDGSIIKGKITNFNGGKFIVAIGDGTRQRQMSFSAEEIESISFDTTSAPTITPQTSNQTDVSLRENEIKPDNKIIVVGENSRNSTPDAPPQVVKTDNTVATIPAQTSTVSPKPANSTPSSSVPQNPTASAVVKTKPIELSVKVLADNTSNGWTNSGFVVRKGQKIRIAGDGRISLGSGRFTTPSGVASLPDNDKLMKAVATGALIAVIGDDNNEFIYVGAEREFTASRDGSLFLGVNEGNLNDNSGAYDVKIEIDPNLGS